jgi:hypothetical protein
MLLADGWTTGPNAGFETIIDRYLKTGTELLANPVGNHSCIDHFFLTLKQSND